MPEMSLSTSARLQASPIPGGGTPVEQWTGWEHRFYAAAEAFLASHLGGRAEP